MDVYGLLSMIHFASQCFRKIRIFSQVLYAKLMVSILVPETKSSLMTIGKIQKLCGEKYFSANDL